MAATILIFPNFAFAQKSQQTRLAVSYLRNPLYHNHLRLKARLQPPSYRFQEALKRFPAKKIIFSCGSNDESEAD